MEGNFWKKLIQPMQKIQQVLNKVSVDWCFPMLFSGEKQHDIGHASWQSDHCLAFTRISLFQLADLDDMSGFLYPRHLSPVIAYFKGIQVVWFCIVSNMFYHTGVILTNKVDHLIQMFLSCCKDFSEQSKEACCDLFSTQSNIFSLVNCTVIIKKYESLEGI